MNITKRMLIASLLLMSFGVPVIADTEHAGKAKLIPISFEAVINDADKARQSNIIITIENPFGVAVVLRGVRSDAGNVRILKKASLFGKTLWNPVDLLQINGEQSIKFDGTRYKLGSVLTKPSGTPVILGFDFGPYGWATVNIVLP